MKQNMGAADRIIRILVVLVLAILIFTGKVSGVLLVVVAIVAAVFLLTSAVGFCPIYRLLGISSRK